MFIPSYHNEGMNTPTACPKPSLWCTASGKKSGWSRPRNCDFFKCYHPFMDGLTRELAALYADPAGIYQAYENEMSRCITTGEIFDMDFGGVTPRMYEMALHSHRWFSHR